MQMTEPEPHLAALMHHREAIIEPLLGSVKHHFFESSQSSRQVMGREVVVAITEGKLDFGPWEQIFYGEFGGRRRKRVLIKIIGD